MIWTGLIKTEAAYDKMSKGLSSMGSVCRESAQAVFRDTLLSYYLAFYFYSRIVSCTPKPGSTRVFQVRYYCCQNLSLYCDRIAYHITFNSAHERQRIPDQR